MRFDPNRGVFVNGERIRIKGVNQHHDLGALGAAFNLRAAERQLEMLRRWAPTRSAWATIRRRPSCSS